MAKIKNVPCTYEFLKASKSLYVGSSCKRNDRLRQQIPRFPTATSVRVNYTNSCDLARQLEKDLCRAAKPKYSKRCG